MTIESFKKRKFVVENMKVKLTDKTIEMSTPGAFVIYELLEDKDRAIIGRGVNCDVRLPRDGYRNETIDKITLTVSKQHCLIYEKGGLIGIMDDSTNGTYIDGKKIPSKKGILLKNGAILKLGDYELEVSIGENKLEK